jgi:hypothetical protein
VLKIGLNEKAKGIEVGRVLRDVGERLTYYLRIISRLVVVNWCKISESFSIESV